MKTGRIRSTWVAACLAAAIFVVCGNRDVVEAEPATALPPIVVPPPSTQPPHKRLAVSPRARAVNALAEPAIGTIVDVPPTVPRGRVYLFRGALGPIFSRGMDALKDKIRRAGISADVYEFTICSLISSTAIEDYKRDPAPIVLIGHSMGGRCTLLFSEALRDEGIPVSLVVTIDPAHLSPDVPLNVERFINIFLSKDILGGGDIKATRGFQGAYASYDLAQHDEVSHITIDKVDAIHQQLIAKILQIAVTPARTPGEALPLRYVVPPREAIELWDSGLSIAAQPRDTLQTIAQQYRLPLWSLTQINQMPDNALLAAGQRIILPRDLVAASSTAEAIAPKR